MAEPNPDLSNDTKIKLLMYHMGTSTGMHEGLDRIRDGFDSRNEVDHNIEQAQIALETAFLRLQQVVKVLSDRKEKEEKVDDDHDEDGD